MSRGGAVEEAMALCGQRQVATSEPIFIPLCQQLYSSNKGRRALDVWKLLDQSPMSPSNLFRKLVVIGALPRFKVEADKVDAKIRDNIFADTLVVAVLVQDGSEAATRVLLAPE